MNEENELVYLIEYLEKYLHELQIELEGDRDDLFLQGKTKGVEHSLLIARILLRGQNSTPIDIIID